MKSELSDSFQKGRGEVFLTGPADLGMLTGMPLEAETPRFLARFLSLLEPSEQQLTGLFEDLPPRAREALLLALALSERLQPSMLTSFAQTSSWFFLLENPTIFSSSAFTEEVVDAVSLRLLQDPQPAPAVALRPQEEVAVPLVFDLASPAARHIYALSSSALTWARRYRDCPVRHPLARDVMLLWGEAADVDFLKETLESELSSPSPSWPKVTDALARLHELGFQLEQATLESVWERTPTSNPRALALEHMGPRAPERILDPALFDLSSCVRTSAIALSANKALLERVASDPLELPSLREQAHLVLKNLLAAH